MQLRALSSSLLAGATMLALPACKSDAPNTTLQESSKSGPRRALVPLTVFKDRLAICRLDRGQPVPSWANAAEDQFFSATRTRDELSLIVPESRAPQEAKCERDWRLLKVRGPLDFNLVGVIAGLSGTLADAGVSIFALSTYETDYVMVKQADFDRALAALRQAAYKISQP